MSRDMKAIAAATSEIVPRAYEMNFGELQELIRILKEGAIIEAFSTAFYYGYALALRAAKRDAKRKRQARENKQGRS